MRPDEAVEIVAAPWRYEQDTVDAAADTLAAAVRRVRELHSDPATAGDGEQRCWECDHTWPCPTIQALDGTS